MKTSFFNRNIYQSLLIDPIPIEIHDLSEKNIDEPAPELNTYSNNEYSILSPWDFDIKRVTLEKTKFERGTSEKPYDLKKLKDIADKLKINKNQNKPMLVKEINNIFYQNQK